ncbi:ABC transporter permease subunit [Leeia sp. TBRC 13508]|uniref:ABC transporter permease subunit n=1 Tax=Leeia speluncae TaxID=2884804 RepID=A0ABS8DA85_9NEIS|nr:ABC transporter permease subunit [Leeia speluncae]MCB6185122.1 ABC transporter permease subunit [Leeia speluncae]
MDAIQVSPGSYFVPFLSWLNINFHGLFAEVAIFFDALIRAIVHVFTFFSGQTTILIIAFLIMFLSGWRSALVWSIGMLICLSLGMWEATVPTLAIILLSVIFSVIVGVPMGVLISKNKFLRIAIQPILDMMQTLPPWVYLVPAVILYGLGVVPALISTVIYGVPPLIRLTILAMTQIPENRIELGSAIGATERTIFWKIKLPSAMPTLLIGINQCVLFSLGMVVLAGLVGAGGLGSEVTRGLSRMEFGLGMRASLAIVILAVVLDRVFRNAIPKKYLIKS